MIDEKITNIMKENIITTHIYTDRSLGLLNGNGHQIKLFN